MKVQQEKVRQRRVSFREWFATDTDPESTIHVTEWADGEGFDVAIAAGDGYEQHFSLSNAQRPALEILLASFDLPG